jgi:hypothetical protein
MKKDFLDNIFEKVWQKLKNHYLYNMQKYLKGFSIQRKN